jgi:uncharacterized protein
VGLYAIQTAVEEREQAMLDATPEWPCRKGCDDCCRSLASEPAVSFEEWTRIRAAIDSLPASETLKRRIVDRARTRVCALLDEASGSCLIYEARPIACRAYGFYAERGKVLGCSRIEDLASESPDILWGNHTAIDAQLRSELGPARPFSEWLIEDRGHVDD